MKIRSILWVTAVLAAVVFGGFAPLCSDETTPGPDVDATAESAPPPSPAAQEAPPRNEAWIIFGSDTVRAEIARTPAERARGLMEREELPPGRGMLFVFPDQEIRSFWMGNTYIPLDIAFIDADLKIVDIQAMEPLTTDSHISRFPAMFALEVPQGWLEEHGIGVGTTATIVFGPM